MLAEKYNAWGMTDDWHTKGFIGKTSRGVHEHCGIMDKVDIITGTYRLSIRWLLWQIYFR